MRLGPRRTLIAFRDCRQVWAGGNGPDATVRQAYAITAREIASNGKRDPPWRPPYRAA